MSNDQVPSFGNVLEATWNIWWPGARGMKDVTGISQSLPSLPNITHIPFHSSPSSSGLFKVKTL